MSWSAPARPSCWNLALLYRTGLAVAQPPTRVAARRRTRARVMVLLGAIVREKARGPAASGRHVLWRPHGGVRLRERAARSRDRVLRRAQRTGEAMVPGALGLAAPRLDARHRDGSVARRGRAPTRARGDERRGGARGRRRRPLRLAAAVDALSRDQRDPQAREVSPSRTRGA